MPRKSEERILRELEAKCHRIAAKLGAIAKEAEGGDRNGYGHIDRYGPAVIEALEGDSVVFWKLDEQPGRYGGYTVHGYAGALRRVRNSPVWGRKMFASFKE